MKLNEELEINYIPEGFHVMDSEELSSLKAYGGQPNWCIKDPERHIIITVSWKKSGFAALLTSSGEVARSMEKHISKASEPFGYELQGFITRNLGEKTTDGFCYTYTAQGIPMTTETHSLKNKKMFYYINIYMRTELLSESETTTASILESCHWS